MTSSLFPQIRDALERAIEDTGCGAVIQRASIQHMTLCRSLREALALLAQAEQQHADLELGLKRIEHYPFDVNSTGEKDAHAMREIAHETLAGDGRAATT